MMANTILEFLKKMNYGDFEKFSRYLFKDVYGSDIYDHENIDGALIRNLTGDVHDYKGIYLIHSIPYALYADPYSIRVDTPIFTQKLLAIYNEYKDRFFFKSDTPFTGKLGNQLYALYFINNILGFSMDYYDDFLVKQYDDIVNMYGLKFEQHDFNVSVGSMDVFLNNQPQKTLELLKQYYNANYSVAIEFLEGKFVLSNCTYDNIISSGVGQKTLQPYYSLISNKIDKKSSIICEFEDLLNNNPSESALEKFLIEYYKDIFGEKYDRIESQIWLRFPEIDISGKDRRLDLFLHNIKDNDWELYEKKSASH